MTPLDPGVTFIVCAVSALATTLAAMVIGLRMRLRYVDRLLARKAAGELNGMSQRPSRRRIRIMSLLGLLLLAGYALIGVLAMVRPAIIATPPIMIVVGGLVLCGILLGSAFANQLTK